jgi:hypothetical protein
MNCKIFKKLIKIIGAATGILFIVYFWNLDQKLMAWLYTLVNNIFDRKKVDQVF